MHVNRTTRRGVDQYVLACNARRDASEVTFQHVERLESEILRLRAEVEWKHAHASTRTANWVRGRALVLMCVLTGVGAVTGWMFTPNGKMARVSAVQGYRESSRGQSITQRKTHFITSDMTQQEIDSLAASMAVVTARHSQDR